jgi:hypothetical protein
MALTIIIQKEFAHYLLDNAVFHTFAKASKHDHDTLDVPNPMYSFLTITGAKLGRNYDGNYYISGYAADRSDVIRLVDRYGFKFTIEVLEVIRAN